MDIPKDPAGNDTHLEEEGETCRRGKQTPDRHQRRWKLVPHRAEERHRIKMKQDRHTPRRTRRLPVTMALVAVATTFSTGCNGGGQVSGTINGQPFNVSVQMPPMAGGIVPGGPGGVPFPGQGPGQAPFAPQSLAGQVDAPLNLPGANPLAPGGPSNGAATVPSSAVPAGTAGVPGGVAAGPAVTTVGPTSPVSTQPRTSAQAAATALSAIPSAALPVNADPASTVPSLVAAGQPGTL